MIATRPLIRYGYREPLEIDILAIRYYNGNCPDLSSKECYHTTDQLQPDVCPLFTTTDRIMGVTEELVQAARQTQLKLIQVGITPMSRLLGFEGPKKDPDGSFLVVIPS
jgi:hypothetical protein